MTHEGQKPGFCETCGAQLESNSQYCSECGMRVSSREVEKSSPGEAAANLPCLYHVSSVANNFPYRTVYYDNLKISWFMVGRQEPPVPFEQAIANYTRLSAPSRVHPENYVKELFTLEEAETVKRYLNSIEMMHAELEDCQLPVSEHATGHRDFPGAPGTDFVILHEKRNYYLPFKVEGIFNTKMADERVAADDRTTVVSGINVNEVRKYLDRKKKESQGKND